MVELPGSLERSTLGDVLGALHRDRVTGTLTLTEIGAGREHQHVIVWREGLIHHVDTTRRAALVPSRGRQAAAHWTQEGADRAELLERLEALFQLTRARLSFRVMGPRPPRTPVPLGPSDFLHGRRRSRDAASTPPPPSAAAPPPAPETPRARALRTLGLRGEPGVDTVRAAFRQLARRWHPDRHPGASETARAVLCRRFAQISGAYEQLIGNSR
jgi:DnaJ-like protein